MNQMELIKRAWQMTWRHKVLWLFGILLALAGGGGGFSGGGGGGGRSGGGGQGGGGEEFDWIRELSNINPEVWGGIALLCCCALLILAVVMTIVQLVSRAALYRSGNQIEATGNAPTWLEGFRLGWTNRTFRLFLLELLVGIAVFFAVMLLLAVAASPLLLLIVDSGVARAIGVGLAIWLFLVWLLIVIVASVVLSVLGQLWAREIVIADRSIGKAFGSGIELLRRQWKDLGVFWLLMLAIAIGFGLVMIPLVTVLIIGGGTLGVGLGVAVHAATGSVIWAIVAGLPVFILIMAIPLSIIQGVYLVFKYSAWTLAYRDVAAARAPRIEDGSVEPLEV